MISDRLLALVRCPDCRRDADRATGERVTCERLRAPVPRGRPRLPRPAAAVEFAEQTKYLDEALHADARHERVSPPLLGSKIRNDMLRAFLAPGPATASSISAAAAAARCSGTATGGATTVGIDISPFFARGGARAASTCCSAICAGCRSPTARSPRRSRSTCSSTCRRRRCAACWPKPRACSRPAARCSSTRTCGRTRRSPSGCAGSTRLARRLERLGLIDMRQERLRKSDHLNPLRDIPELEQVAARRRLPHRAHPLLHADRRRLRREHPDAHGRARDGAPRGAPAAARCRRGGGRRAQRSARRGRAAKQPDRQEPGDLRASLRGAVGRDEARPAAVRPDHARARSSRCSSRSERLSCRCESSTPPSIRPCPGTIGGSVHVAAVAEGLAALGHEVHVLVDAGRRRFPAGAGALDRDGAAARAQGAALGADAARSTRLARAARPDVIIERYYNFGGEGDPRRRGARRDRGARSERAGHRLSAARPKALLDRALLVEPMRRWRERLCRTADLIVTPSAAILPPDTPPRRSSSSSGAPTPIASSPDARGPLPFARPRRHAGGLRRRVPQLARRGPPRRRDQAAATRAGATTSRRVFIGDGPELAARPGRGRGARRRRLHRRRAARRDAGVPGRRRHRRRAVRLGAHAPLALGLLLVAAEDLRVHGGRPAGRRAGAARHRRARRPRARRRCSTIRGGPGRSPTRSQR